MTVGNEELKQMLLAYHHIFSVEEDEHRETALVQLNIDTGDAFSKRQSPRRIPFAVRREVPQLLEKMQNKQVIQPSSSPWASPMVLVRKKDGSLRFRVDYHKLNKVTKADTSPLPRID